MKVKDLIQKLQCLEEESIVVFGESQQLVGGEAFVVTDLKISVKPFNKFSVLYLDKDRDDDLFEIERGEVITEFEEL
jgi:hypothetical protein